MQRKVIFLFLIVAIFSLSFSSAFSFQDWFSDFYSKITGRTTTGNETVCTESWSCSEWGTCTNSLQSRTCTDSNNCGTTNSKPVESQSCSECTDECSS